MIDWAAVLRSNFQNKGLLNNDVSSDPDESEFNFDGIEDVKYKKFKFIRATNAFEMALEICAFARFLNELNKLSDGIKYNLFQDKTCDGFLPTVSVMNRKRRKKKRNKSGQKFGNSAGNSKAKRYPWMCSLKEAGYRGSHRCGVTLLSGELTQIISLNKLELSCAKLSTA